MASSSEKIPITDPTPGTGIQNKDTPSLPHPRLPDETRNLRQPPPTLENMETTEYNNTRESGRGRGRGRGRNTDRNRARPFSKLRPHEGYMENKKILEEIFTNK